MLPLRIAKAWVRFVTRGACGERGRKWWYRMPRRACWVRETRAIVRVWVLLGLRVVLGRRGLGVVAFSILFCAVWSVGWGVWFGEGLEVF